MIKRRQFLQSLGAGMVLPIVGTSSLAQKHMHHQGDRWLMPDESAAHQCTWMAFGASRKIWGGRLLPAVQDNLGTIARYEPVRMLVRENDVEIARHKCGKQVELIIAELDDLWMRDTGPVFVKNQQQELAGVNFNFNGWGEKQAFSKDATVAGHVAKNAKVGIINTDLVLEGGGIEVDGEGTAICTESCILNPNRNPGLSRTDCETELHQLLGIEKVIWLPGITGKDITDGHTDFYARFTRPGVVLNGMEADPEIYDYKVTREHLKILQSATDAKGRSLAVIPLEGPKTIRTDFENDAFAAGYIGFYVLNGAVVVQQFGDRKADNRTRQIIQKQFPKRVIEMINIDAIAAGGGSIHCTTQQQPAPKDN